MKSSLVLAYYIIMISLQWLSSGVNGSRAMTDLERKKESIKKYEAERLKEYERKEQTRMAKQVCIFPHLLIMR